MNTYKCSKDHKERIYGEMCEEDTLDKKPLDKKFCKVCRRTTSLLLKYKVPESEWNKVLYAIGEEIGFQENQYRDELRGGEKGFAETIRKQDLPLLIGLLCPEAEEIIEKRMKGVIIHEEC